MVIRLASRDCLCMNSSLGRLAVEHLSGAHLEALPHGLLPFRIF